MSLLGIVRYLNGYVEICVKGDCAEQFINICSREKITVWNIRKELGVLKMRVSVKDFKNIRNVRKKSKLKFQLKIIKKHGIRFKLYRHRKRKGLLIGIVIFFAFLIYMNNFIWTVDVEGNKNLDKNKILSACEELGVYEGVYKDKVDAYNLPPKLTLMLDDIAWCSFNIEGTKLTVEISEAKVSAKDELTAANLVAARDGVIEKLEITDGTKAVKVGQAVRKGDLLASGLIDNGVRTYTVKADGVVIARTERTFSFAVPKYTKVLETDGKKKKFSVINIFGMKIPLYFGSINYDYLDSFYEKHIKLFKTKIPISVSTRTFERVKVKIKENDLNTAKNSALELLATEAKLLELYTIEIEKIEHIENEDEFIYKIVTTCTENICEYKEINIDNKLKNSR